MVIQLAAATPLLVTSSLAYAKTSYRDSRECIMWDRLGWFTLSLGYLMLLNSLTIMLYTSHYRAASYWFIGVSILLFAVYSLLDVRADRSRFVEKGGKLTFYVGLVFLGAILPIAAGWL
jgi:hypothetical protein